ncbi:MAG TPA: pyridoxal-dependent decarboxylase, partial [Ignavibacteriales bacterium]|nr:pyridoxal-dependent decarboxylase [Ignavibacteriales bacterium]
QIRKNGLQVESARPLRAYCSEHAHSSVEKAVIALGLGINGLKKIGTDDQFRMDVSELRREIKKDKEAGFQPFCVVATVGTTSFTSIDPVSEIAEVCKKENMWLHVDASFGGCAAIIPEMRHVLDGCEMADSLIMNPHKWMFTPVDVSILFTSKRSVLKQAFSLVPEYLKTQTEGEVDNYMDYGIALGRRFRSLKLWLVIKYFGESGLADRLRENIRLGGLFKSYVEKSPIFELIAPVPFSVVCFRAKPEGYSEDELNALNQKLMDSVNADGDIFISHTKIKDKLVLRFVIANLRMEERHIRSAWDVFNKKLEILLKK